MDLRSVGREKYGQIPWQRSVKVAPNEPNLTAYKSNNVGSGICYNKDVSSYASMTSQELIQGHRNLYDYSVQDELQVAENKALSQRIHHVNLMAYRAGFGKCPELTDSRSWFNNQRSNSGDTAHSFFSHSSRCNSVLGPVNTNYHQDWRSSAFLYDGTRTLPLHQTPEYRKHQGSAYDNYLLQSRFLLNNATAWNRYATNYPTVDEKVAVTPSLTLRAVTNAQVPHKMTFCQKREPIEALAATRKGRSPDESNDTNERSTLKKASKRPKPDHSKEDTVVKTGWKPRMVPSPSSKDNDPKIVETLATNSAAANIPNLSRTLSVKVSPSSDYEASETINDKKVEMDIASILCSFSKKVES